MPQCSAAVADDGRPVALIPDSSRRYLLVDPAKATPESRLTPRSPADCSRTRSSSTGRSRPISRLSAVSFGFAVPAVRRELWTLVLMGLICGLLGLVVPTVMAVAIDDAIPRADREQLDLLCAFLVAVALAFAAFQAIQTVALARLRGKLESSLLPAFWDRLLSLPVRFFAQYEAGDLAVRALGPVRLIEVLASTTVASMLASVFALFNVAALFFLNWRLGLVAAGLMAVFPLATAAALRPLWHCQRGISEIRGEIAGLLFLLLGGISRLRVAGAEPRAFARGRCAINSSSAEPALPGDRRPAGPLRRCLADRRPDGHAGDRGHSARAFLSLGEFLAFNTSLMLGVAAVVGLGKGAISLIDGLRECERFAPILAAAPEVNEVCGELVRLAGAIRLDNVSFRYTPDGPLVLEAVNFQVRPGEFVAVVGPSGSGKSTLLAALARVRDADRRVRLVRRPRAGDARHSGGSPPDRGRPPGCAAPPRRHLFQHRRALHQPDARRRLGRGRARRPGRRHRTDADGHPYGRDRGRQRPVERPATTVDHRPRPGRAAQDPLVRRGHQRSRQPHPGACQPEHPRPAPRDHASGDRPPAQHRDRRRSHLRLERRNDRSELADTPN